MQSALLIAVASLIWTAADTQRFKSVREVQISPDGSLVAFVLARSDLARNRNFSSIAVVRARGGDVKLLTPEDASDDSPRWSTDGSRIAYLGEGDGLWVMGADGSDKHRLVTLVQSNEHVPESGDTFAWSRDGRFIVYAAADPDVKPAGRDPLVITRLIYKSTTDYVDNLLTQIWSVPSAGGVPRRLSDGKHVDHSPAWSPDGREVVFASNREDDPDAHHNNDLFSVDVASGRLRRLTETRGSEYRPAWSPDGKWILYLATKRDWTTTDSIAEDLHLWVVPAAGGAARALNEALDRRTESAVWSPDSGSVLFTAQDRGRILPYRVVVGGGESKLLFESDLQVGPVSLSGNGRAAFSLTSTARPVEVGVLDSGASAPRTVTGLNAESLSSFPVAAAETLGFTSTGDTRVEGWAPSSAGT